MADDWKAKLISYLEESRIIQTSIRETLDNFNHFCEFVVEPAFEALSEELLQFRIKTKLMRVKGRSIAIRINYAGSRIDNFNYIISLPKKSFELKLWLKIKGRKDKKSPCQEKVEPFMNDVEYSDILNLDQNDLIQDIIKHYRNFNFEALARV